MGIMIVTIVIILFIVLYTISVYNNLHVSIVKIEESDSGIDVALNKRYDVLVKLLDTVKGYTKYEKETLENIVALRSHMSIAEKTEVNNKINETLSKIQVMIENYPDLKASDNYKTLQKAIIDVEEHLQAARRLYNSNVSRYNQLVVSFPSSIIASSSNLTKKEFFEVEELKKQDVKMDF